LEAAPLVVTPFWERKSEGGTLSDHLVLPIVLAISFSFDLGMTSPRGTKVQ